MTNYIGSDRKIVKIAAGGTSTDGFTLMVADDNSLWGCGYVNVTKQTSYNILSQ